MTEPKSSTVKSIKESYCHLVDGTYCHSSKFRAGEFSNLKEGIIIKYESEIGATGHPAVKTILSVGEMQNSMILSSRQLSQQYIPSTFQFAIQRFSDDNGKIQEALIGGSENDKNSVKSMAKSFSNGKKLTSTQLRRFYDEVLGYDGLEFEKLKTKLDLLVAKVAYGVGRGTLPNNFLDFFKNRVDCVREEKDFEFFLQHFEAFVAWFKFYEPNK